MKLSLGWIGDFHDLTGVDAAGLAERLTLVTAEIEGLERRGEGLSDVIAARVSATRPHPRATRLTLCDVDTSRERLQVVCGAPNVAAGAIVAFAPPGSSLPGGRRIERAEIRGVASEGMICSQKELQLGEEADGIWLLPGDLPIGRRLEDVLPVKDAIIEIDNKSLTHRPDLWGHYGFARELSAILGRPLEPLPVVRFEIGEAPLPVALEVPEWCPRYLAAVVRNVAVAPSPAWMQIRLESVGVRPINGLVDLTNYVMLEIGQPIHAFDLDRLSGPEIRVRRARSGEGIRTLDGVERSLTEEALVIADRESVVAVAGVMGGETTEISSATRSLVLESATFHPTIVRKTAQRLALRTEASSRFEKNLDPEFAREGVGRFLDLLPRVIPGARLEGSVADRFPAPPKPKVVPVSLETVRQRLGVDIPEERVTTLLRSLEFAVSLGPDALQVTVPSFRATKDVSIEMDVIEEVGRLYGYDRIPEKSPLVPCEPPTGNPRRMLERELKQLLTCGLGFVEVATYSFVADEVLAKAGLDPERHLHVRNPIASNLACLRASLVPNLLAILDRNLRHRGELRLFELGRSYLKEDRGNPALPVERQDLVAILCRRDSTGSAFFELKGIVQALLDRLSLASPELRAMGAATAPWIHPSRSAAIAQGSRVLGEIADLHPAVARAFDVNSAEVAFCRLDVDELLRSGRPRRLYEPLPKFPAIRQDLSIIVPDRVPAADLDRAIRAVAPDLISGVRLFDVYTGEQVGRGKRSLTFEITYRAEDRTLRDADVATVHSRVVDRMRSLGAVLRGE